MPARIHRRAVVLSSTQLTPHMVRIVLGGDGLNGFSAGEFTDHYVKLQLPPPGADYTSDFDPDQIRAERPREQWPLTRTYSVRAWDAARGELTVDFVVHGSAGVAGPWAAAARPGDTVLVAGPGGGYAPDPSADWHLLIGDTSVIPAIAASLPRIPPQRPVVVVLEVDGPEEEQPLETAGELELHWVHAPAGPGEDPTLLLEAVQGLAFPPGRGQAFVHGEASAVRAVRRHLLLDRGLPAHDVSASGYWKLRRTDEQWREDKPEWKRLVAADVA